MKKIMAVILLALFLFPVVASAELKVVIALSYFNYGENSAVVPLEKGSYVSSFANTKEVLIDMVEEQIAKGETLQKLSREGWKIVHIDLIRSNASHVIITLQK